MSSLQDPAVQSAWHDPNIAARYINAENATRPYAKSLVAKAKLSDITENVNIFDLATGTGAAVQEIYDAVPKEQWGKVKVLGGDVSESMLGYLKERGKNEGWEGLETAKVDGNALAFPPESFTHVFCTFAIFALPDVLSTLFNVTKPGGFVGVSTWASLPWISLLSASIALMPSAPYSPTAHEISTKLYSGRAWDDPAYLASQLSAAGFVNVGTETKKHKAKVGSVGMFMETMQMPLMLVKGFWPEEQREALVKELNACMKGEVQKLAGEDGAVEMEFEGVCGWGWKGE